MANVHLIKKGNYCIIQMDREKSNPMNYELVAELRIALKNLQDDNEILGAILNGKENFFSAGLDIPELFTYDEKQFDKFWHNFMDLIADIIAFDKPLVASITGHAPAGGCILAMGCDYRVMAEGNYKIGLNEIPVGIVVPRGIFDLYSFWIGRKTAYQYLMEGKLYSPEHAQQIGLVDELSPKENILEQAEAQLKKYLQYNQNGWRQTKRQLRYDLLESMHSITDFDMKIFQQQWWHSETRAIMQGFIDKLKK